MKATTTILAREGWPDCGDGGSGRVEGIPTGIDSGTQI